MTYERELELLLDQEAAANEIAEARQAVRDQRVAKEGAE